MQCAGLAKRLEHTKATKTVIGVSGGLDSTLALLVCAATHKLLGKNTHDILTLTMPGFGTTNETRQTSYKLMGLLGTEIREIAIHEAVLQHFKDINHNPNIFDVTYENSQSRERTQILMDIANKENGIVIGTGDLSESALGWCTFNGDHMSMYNVNAGVPKTLVRHLIRWIIDYKLNGPNGDMSFSFDNSELSYALEDVLNTPISPELLPPNASGGISQKTEEVVGPYVLNDFFIYYTMRHGFSPDKLLYIASQAFKDEYPPAVIKRWLSVFYKRFFSQQFKRNCSPDGLKIGSVSFDSHGIFKMPSDMDCSLWNT
jgi:NAD+ synthase (glutamine-hydrolysing)